MSYGDIKRKMAEVRESPVISTSCPAHGCPNAASVSLDAGGHWACYAHASVPFDKWHEATRKIRHEWPASGNWNHPEKVLYENEASAARRAALRRIA